MVDLLATYLSRPDLIDRLPISPDARNILKTLGRIIMHIGGMILREAQFPPSSGYEPYLIEQGCNQIAARGLSHLAVRSGKRRALDSKYHQRVVEAIRYLAKPQGSRKVVVRKAKLLLRLWKRTSVIETVFSKANMAEFEFVRLLQSVETGRSDAIHRLSEIAAFLAQKLSVRRGPKASADSMAHEFFVRATPDLLRDTARACTWNPVTEDFTDQLTQAARREFGNPDFDPRPALRRVKANPGFKRFHLE